MLANLTIIGKVVLQLPEVVVVALPVVRVRGFLPTTKVNRRLESLCVRTRDIIAKFCMENKVLEEVDLSKDVTCELTAIERIAVHHGHCDRIRIGVTLTSLCVVVSVNIIDGNVGNSGK